MNRLAQSLTVIIFAPLSRPALTASDFPRKFMTHRGNGFISSKSNVP